MKGERERGGGKRLHSIFIRVQVVVLETAASFRHRHDEDLRYIRLTEEI